MPSRAEVYAAIDTERTYQDALGPDRVEMATETAGGNPAHRTHSVGDYLVMLQRYLGHAVAAWTDTPGDAAALDVVRKIAGIAVHCMEDHGAPPRVAR